MAGLVPMPILNARRWCLAYPQAILGRPGGQRPLEPALLWISLGSLYRS